MARVIVIDDRDSIAELVVNRLRERPTVDLCQRAPQRSDGSGSELNGGYARLLDDQGIDTVVYSPPLEARNRVIPDLADAQSVFKQCARAGIKKAVVLSSAAVNSPSPRHLGLVCEARLSPRHGRNSIASQWLELEALAEKYLGQPTDTKLTILRPVAVPVRGGTDYFSQLLSRRLAITLPGHDPSIQLLSPDDLADAVCRAVESSQSGLYNVAPDGVIPLRKALRLIGSRRVPVPRWLQWLTRQVLAPLGLAFPVEQLEYIRYSWTVSNQRIKREWEFAPQRSSTEALRDLLVSQRVNESMSQKRVWEYGGMGVWANTPPRPHTPTPPRPHVPTSTRPHTHSPIPAIRDPRSAMDEFDDFGMDKNYIAAFGRTLFHFLHRYYWRVEVNGLDHVPREGRAVLVGVHRGFMPWDGVMALHEIVRKLGRYPRFLIHPGLIKFPFLFNYMTKLGGIIACQKNADYVLGRDELLGFFPEGIRGAFSLYRDAYQLGRFGANEFVKMALRNRAPIVPFVTVGSAEIFPILGKIEWQWWKRWTEWPFFPITPTWPLLPLPLPSKWHTQFLPPLHVESRYPPEAADDVATVRAISLEVRSRMQEAIERLLSRRKSIFFGSIFDEELN